MLNARLGEIARRPEAPFLGASAGDDTLGRTVEAFGVSARVNEGGIPKGIEALEAGAGAGAAVRLRRRGARSRAEVDAGGVRPLVQRARHVREPGLASGARGAVSQRRPGRPVSPSSTTWRSGSCRPITTTETAALARELVTETNRVVIAVAPEKKGVTPPTRRGRAGRASQWSRGDADGVAATNPRARSLMPQHRRRGRSRRAADSEIGVTVLTLSNGVEVWLKPTDFKNDQIVFTAYAKGGTTNVPRAITATRRMMTASSARPASAAVAGRSRQAPVGADRERVAAMGRIRTAVRAAARPRISRQRCS
jgi:zinc protease